MEDLGLEGGIALDTEGIDDAVWALDDLVQSAHEFASVAQLASAGHRERARKGRDEEVPHCVELSVVREGLYLVNCGPPLFDEALSFLEVLFVLLLLVGELDFQRAIGSIPGVRGSGP